MAAPMQTAPTESGEAGAPSTENQDAKHQVVLDAFNKHFKHSKTHFADWREEAKSLYDLKAGRQWDVADEATMDEEQRPMVTFNIADKYSDAITGLQINNRQETRFFPREIGDAKLNELLTGSVNWGRDLCDQADEETDAFTDAVWTGMGWMEGYLDKDLEPTGVPAGQRVDNMQMYADPSHYKRNASDSRFVIRLKPVDQDEYAELSGGEEYAGSESDEIAHEDDDEPGIQVIEEPQDYNSTSTNPSEAKKGKCIVADYQFWKRERRYLIKHPQLGDKELTDEEHTAYKPFFERAAQNGQAFSIQPIKRKVYYRAFISKGRILQYGLSPYQHGFTYHCITGKRDRNKNTWYGIGRAILDPQRWLNKFFSTILYTLMVNAKGGLMAEEGSFKDARKAESEWAKPNSITWMKKGALANGSVLPKPESPYPAGLERLMDFSLNSLPQVTGMNVELMGLADRVQAGVVEAQRKQSAMAVIAWAFDGMRRYYRSMGRQQAQYVIDYVPEGTLVLINGADSKKYVPLLKSQVAMQFDVITEEAPTSVNMKERVWLVLENLIPQLLQAGLAIPPEVLDYSPLPADLAQKWKEALKPDPNKQKIDEAMVTNQLKKLVAEVFETQTKGQLNLAKAEEAGSSGDLKQMQAVETAANAGAAQAHPVG